jgi:regulator of sirC expression with transglutaminase-like and TPR domain
VDSAQRFEQALSTAGPRLPLDTLCGLLGAVVEPGLDAAEVLDGLDRLAEDCPTDFTGVIQHLFVDGRLRGDTDTYHAPENSVLHHVLRRGRGMPITLSVVAIEVGRRVGVEVAGVALPGHFVVRLADTERFADPFGGGVLHDRRSMEAAWLLQQPRAQRLPDAELWEPCSPRLIVMRILNNLKHSLATDDRDPRLAGLYRLRSMFAEFGDETAERRRVLRHWN